MKDLKAIIIKLIKKMDDIDSSIYCESFKWTKEAIDLVYQAKSDLKFCGINLYFPSGSLRSENDEIIAINVHTNIKWTYNMWNFIDYEIGDIIAIIKQDTSLQPVQTN